MRFHIIHHNDEDGICSAGVIYEYLKNKYGNNTKKNIKTYMVDYTVDLDTILEEPRDFDEYYFLDYSFSNNHNLDIMKKLAKNNKVVWIDHHKKSIDIYKSNEDLFKSLRLNYLLDTSFCGAELSYLYAYNSINNNKEVKECDLSFLYTDEELKRIDEIVPEYVKYVNAWDTFKFDKPRCEDFNIGANSIEHTPTNMWSKILKYSPELLLQLFKDPKERSVKFNLCIDKFINNCIEVGQNAKLYITSRNKKLCDEKGFMFYILDCRTSSPKMYSCFGLNSEVSSKGFGDLIDEYSLVVPFIYNGERFKYSLFTNRDDLDCSELASVLGDYIDGYGGGGHKKAAGFQTKNLILHKSIVIKIRKCTFSKRCRITFE